MLRRPSFQAWAFAWHIFRAACFHLVSPIAATSCAASRKATTCRSLSLSFAEQASRVRFFQGVVVCPGVQRRQSMARHASGPDLVLCRQIVRVRFLCPHAHLPHREHRGLHFGTARTPQRGRIKQESRCNFSGASCRWPYFAGLNSLRWASGSAATSSSVSSSRPEPFPSSPAATRPARSSATRSPACTGWASSAEFWFCCFAFCERAAS